MFVKQKKEPVEKLQEEFLTGPADESIDKVAEELQENQVIIAKEPPDYETIVFRNQRDPGHVLDFHYSSSTHPFKMYSLIDGKSYKLPKEVIKNLEGCRENKESYRKNSDGIPEIYISGYKSYFICERV